jgi:hypothetical protein
VADQLWYFAELDGQTSLSAGLQHYDYAVSRHFWKGDDALFRPLLFVWLAVGNTLFSYQHVWWNSANLALHLLTATCLFRLLMVINPSPFALLATLLFVASKPALELVLWNHLGGYLLACSFMMIALRALVLRLRAAKCAPSCWVNATYVAAMTGATLTYESMVPTAVLWGMLLLWLEYRRGIRPSAPRILLVLLPVLIYGGLYALHAAQAERISYVDRSAGMTSSLLHLENLLRAAMTAGIAVARWTTEMLLPSALSFSVAPYARLGKELIVPFQSWLPWLNLVGAAVIVWFMARSFSRRHWRRSFPVACAVLAAVCCYIGLISLGRSVADALANTYYLYPFCLLAIVLGYTCSNVRKPYFRFAPAAGVTVGLLVLTHAVETRNAVAEIGKANAEASVYLLDIARFVASNAADPDFSFRIQSPPSLVDPEIELRAGYPDAPSAVFYRRVSQILFTSTYRESGAKYLLDTSRVGDLRIISRRQEHNPE